MNKKAKTKLLHFSILLVVLLSVLLLPSVKSNPGTTTITGCSNLSVAGEIYILKANISNSTTSNCINITAENVTLDCRNNIIDGDDSADHGIVIKREASNTTNTIIRNCKLIDWDNGGIYLHYSNSSTLTNVTVDSDNYDGIYLSYSNNNTFTNVSANSNSPRGIYLASSDSNTFTNVIANSNTQWGIYVLGSDNNIFTNVTANSNAYYGIYLDWADSNTIKESEFWNNTQAGFYSAGTTNSNLIYNNLFNNTLNFGYDGIGANSWNITKQTGDRKISSGTEIGGNYWANLTGDGYSETCTDSDTDGFCDTEYTLASDNVDYLPMSDESTAITDCAVLNKAGATYYLTANISNSTTSNCINITAENVTLDCHNNIIDGNDVAVNGIVIKRESTETTNATIRNCRVIDWDTQNIYLRYVDNNTLINITLTSSLYDGIYLSSSDSNTLTNITANFNNQRGIDLWGSDSNTFTNVTANFNGQYGILLVSSHSNTLTNVTANSNPYYGISLLTANSNTFTNITANSNSQGIRLGSSDNNTIKESEFWNNTNAGIYSSGDSNSNVIYNNLFNNTLNFDYLGIGNNSWNTTKQASTNIVGQGWIGGNYWANLTGDGYSETCDDTNKDGFCDTEYTLATDNIDYLPLSTKYSVITDCSVLNEAGETYYLAANISNSTTSNCINITAENVTLDCRNNIIDGDDSADHGIVIKREASNTTNTIIRNCKLIDWDNGGIYLHYSNSSTLTNVTVDSDNYDGIYLSYSNNNTFTNVSANSNSPRGIYLASSDSNTFTNVIANSNTQWGIYVLGSDNNIFTNVTANSNAYYGIYLDWADSNTIKESEFWNNTQAGFYSAGTTNSNLIYNNLFNNTLNFGYDGIGANSWNITKQTGDRKISSGTEIGGNYWANLTGDGYSETCTDSDTDGFCDTEYTLASDNVDYLPMSDESTAITDCAVLNKAGATYYLTANISNSTTSNCINITAENVTLDCHNNIIDGNDVAVNGIVIKRESTETTNATIRNCRVIDWDTQNIYLRYVDNNTLINITLTSSLYDGIYLSSSDSNTLTNITANFNNQRGIDLWGSDSNTFTNVTANFNGQYGILLVSSHSNTLTNVTANSNPYYGISLLTANSNTFTNITANSNSQGIRLGSSDNNTIKESEFWNNTNAGIYSSGDSNSNVIYNNLFNNTLNFDYLGIGNNSWNTTKQASTNIVGQGWIGGNYWANLTGDGYSETCDDTNKDGFCDTEYTLATDNIDYLPLSTKYSVITDCSVLNEAGETYYLAANISNSTTSNCINITAENVTLDCRNNIIDGDDVADYGIIIKRESSETTNATIRNCRVLGWDTQGIYLKYSDSNTFTNITANSNYDGLWLYLSNSNTLTNITANSNDHHGIKFSSSDSNTLTNITANSNIHHGIFLYFSSDSSTFTNITANSNGWYGIYLYSSSSNTIKESEFFNNTDAGIFFYGYDSQSNVIYNNLFNNTLNFNYNKYIGANFWNTTKQAGTNIIGQGWIGGNYWANLTGDGYSDTCWDTTGDYICENSYTLKATNNIDYLPLTSNSDTTYPLIAFDSGTLANNSFRNQTFIYANWTYTEVNLQNITAELFNTTGLVNRTGFTIATYEINWSLDNLNERYYYNISILDKAGNFNKTETRNITIDTTNPIIPNVSISPNTDDDLDPDVQINVTANITDALAGVNTTILQYKFHSATKFTNVTMRYNSTTKLYNASFTPNIAGEWTYRVWANDTANNIYSTTATNASVYKDYTWVRSPADAGTILGILTTTKEILNLTINNTGEYSLSFDISDTAPYGSSYNQTIPFTIAAGESKTIAFDATFGSTTREDAVVITIDSTTPNADPSETTTNFTLASYAGGPFFDVIIDTYPTSINQSRTAIIRAYVKNIGNETSIQTWLNWTLPSGVTNTSGNITQNVTLNETSNLTAGSKLYNTLNITVNETTVEIGSITIYAKATGLNSTGSVISKEANKSITITCYSGDGVCGKGCNYHTDTDCEVPKNVTTTTTTPGGGGGVPSVFEAEATYELIRGRDEVFILPIENPYPSKTLTNIRVSASGYLAQYIKIEPPENVSANETGEIKVKILAPSYFTVGMHNLTFTIQLIAKEKGTADISRIEKRYVYLAIHELGKEDSEKLINKIENYINSMKKLNLETEGIEELYDKSLDAINKSDYESVNEIYEESKELAEAAFNSYSIVKGLEEKLNETSKYGIETPKTDRLISLAKSALERGDYLLALERVKDAQLTYIIETKGKFGLIYYIRKNTFEFFLYTIATLILLTILYFRTKISVINYNLKGLQQEEDTLLGLMRVVQKECFEERKMSMSEYNDAMLQYEDKLSKAVQRTIELEAEKANLLKFKHRKLELERKRLLDLMKTTQEKYLKEGAIETQVYNNKMHSFVARLSELEENLALQEAKQTLRKRKLFWRIFYSVFRPKPKAKSQKKD